MDITYRTEYAILEVKPDGPLSEDDFGHLESELQSIRSDADRDLKGVLIKTESFPGYEQLSDVLGHGEFVLDHADDVSKVAICTDSTIGSLVAGLGQLFGGAETKTFSYDETDDAEKWLLA
ncbi:MAG: STAS/SEC14 domain-containing protein [Phycisphaeraceae bacterium]|nr:STAS/SEC14 domain-containing protein [Phycisphaeraceae bacterium]